MTSDYLDFLDLMQLTDSEHKLTSKQIALRLGTSRRVVREYMRQARREGVPVASDTTAVWMEPDIDKCLEVNQHLRRRALDQIVTFRIHRQKLKKTRQEAIDEKTMQYRMAV